MIASAIKKAYKAWEAFKEKLAWAKGVLKKADERRFTSWARLTCPDCFVSALGP